jgi:hypothetical protein
MAEENSTISSPELTKPDENEDAELKAMNAVVGALSSLTDEQRQRALEYVLRRFNVTALQTTLRTTTPPSFPLGPDVIQPDVSALGAIHDIRTLKETKAPKSANEMAALVAYYVSELAPANDRKKEITKADIERYFKTAGFNLPADASFTLVNAKNAGYLDSAGTGQYKLNPVGYNLVAHRMGTDERKTESRRRPAPGKKRRKRNSTKKALR